MLVSPGHREEIGVIEDELERTQLIVILEMLGNPIDVDLLKTRQRAEELVNLGFGVADAAHVAFAEVAGADFISCDKKLIKKCLREKVKVWCGNPVGYCEKEDLK